MRIRSSVVAAVGVALVLSACSSTASDSASDTPAAESSSAAPSASEATEAPAEAVSLRWRTRPDNQAEADLYASISDEITASGIGLDLTYEP